MQIFNETDFSKLSYDLIADLEQQISALKSKIDVLNANINALIILVQSLSNA